MDQVVFSPCTARVAAIPIELVFERGPGPVSSLWAALEEIRTSSDRDQILRRAVEVARDVLGLAHARIVWLDRPRGAMLGTWGMDPSGAVVDERAITLELRRSDREALRRLEQEGAPFTVFEDHPLTETGWVAKTPIASMRRAIAMFVNDAGTTDAAVDETKQISLAILCSMLGELLAPVSRRFIRSAPAGARGPESVVASIVAMLDRDPGLAGKELAASLDIQLASVRSVFRVLVGMSLTDYRNQLRLDRFQTLLAGGSVSLKSAARQAGFGSYAQFHRVFRAHVRKSPREYLGRARAERNPSRTDRATSAEAAAVPLLVPPATPGRPPSAQKSEP